MNGPNKFDGFISGHPREALQLALVMGCLIWQSLVCAGGLLLYLCLFRGARIQWWVILALGVFCGVAVTAIDYRGSLSQLTLHGYLMHGFFLNKLLWKFVIIGHDEIRLFQVLNEGAAYVLGLPMFYAGLLSAVHLIKENPHQSVIKALQQGNLVSDKKELTEKQIQAALKKIDLQSEIGTVLGVSKYTGEPVVIPDQWINQIMLVLGTTGAGKTVTLRRFYERAMIKNYPLIIVDAKPSDDNVEWLEKMAKKYDKKFYGFNCGNYAHFDPLANGGYTELKDKIISLKDQWENDYYRSIAETYLQVTFEVLLKSGEIFDLERVIECLEHDDLISLARHVGDPVLLKRVVSLDAYDSKDITGLKAHLSLLVHSELGEYFKNKNAFTLSQVISENAMVYFSLPALRFPSFSSVLGKLVINDIKATIDRESKQNKKLFMVFDEFSVFAGQQVLNLVNMGRGKGVHAIFGTQGLADLNAVDENFKNQVLNCINTIICHRLNDQDSAEAVSAWMGTKDAFTVTAQLTEGKIDGGNATVRVNKEYIIHPEQIKQELLVGEVFCASKIKRGRAEKILIKYD